ncbi:hypothetical protein N7499_008556 [Penicillium canescens]|uniref:Uncharacterized protein n=1 Tax=Penicillium canescens TaxID=5083 RepID=A0AAD6N285_PENCN|nr:uncharacterized protein N7446_013592 [Penicillium canescens]KAJ5985166.1 hypothetical protein N7522_012362 [Penicillium canescens]KAJ6023232.1 hypothetical protein N7460_013627 [Penicillium canescens]KAJ6025498.1 hypothetical protein N7444_013177 [Penicillium canescens]KAJ6042526.1 hypothetical protein N7446_013592 [Penicillium canescens]KAJ6076575.1 hypothetical protein N7499_008556 [Penicillium canescens]
MQSTPNRTSKIPRPWNMSPRVSQESKIPQENGNSQNTSPQLPIQSLPVPVQDEFPLVSQLTQDLEDCDWEQLQNKYSDSMEEHSRVEENLRIETAKLLEVFMAWSQTTVLQDENRALKRFKTQMQHVQHSEVSMENKRKHYTEVVKAFQSALALLNEQLKV